MCNIWLSKDFSHKTDMKLSESDWIFHTQQLNVAGSFILYKSSL